MPLGQTYFDSLFSGNDDPWGFKTRWYEMRKRAITLASLPQPRYQNAFEPGCANGELAASLAERCDRLLCTDGAARAVELASKRLLDFSHVTVAQACVPQDWPDGQFDLIVVSELGYFLSCGDLDALSAKAQASLAPSGTLLACHWRRSIKGCDMTGDEVHARLAKTLALPHAVQWQDADFRLDVWFGDGHSVGDLQGLS